jgi:hypothetical protein
MGGVPVIRAYFPSPVDNSSSPSPLADGAVEVKGTAEEVVAGAVEGAATVADWPSFVLLPGFTRPLSAGSTRRRKGRAEPVATPAVPMRAL